MFAAHLGAGLAIRAAQPKAPAWAVLTAAFLPDLFWIVLAGAGIEPASDTLFFDGWSHSVASILLQALIFGLCFARLGRGAAVAIGTAVLSHLLLDTPIHPRPLEMFPHASFVIGYPAWTWGEAPLALGKTHYWWLQLAVTLPLLTFYALRSSKLKMPINLIAASCVIVLGLHLLF